MALYHLILKNPYTNNLVINYRLNGSNNHITIGADSMFDMFQISSLFSYETDSTNPNVIQDLIINKFFGSPAHSDAVILNLNPNPFTGEIRGLGFDGFVVMPSINTQIVIPMWEEVGGGIYV